MAPPGFLFLTPAEDPVVGSHVLRLSVIALLAWPTAALAGTAGGILISVGETTGELWGGGQAQLGIDLSLGPRLSPLQLAAYAAGSRWTNSTTAACDGCGPSEETVGEVGVGVRGVWGTQITHVSLGGGPVWGSYHVDEAPSYSYTLRGMGWWAGGDALIRAGSHVGIGGGARYSRIEYDRVTSSLYAWSYHGSIGWLWGSNR